MKFRLLDTLQCACGSTRLAIEDSVIKRVSFPESLVEVRCKKTCGYRQCSIAEGTVTPRDCMDCYTNEVVEGVLSCECGRQWPIVNGLPRFLPREMAADIRKTQKTFSFEWKMFRFGERNWGQDMSTRKTLFLKAMGVDEKDLQGKLILDAGCGSGALAIEMAQSFGMEVIALDLAFGIEKAYEHNVNPNVHFIQGSVLDPPLQQSTFDYLYCAGVLIHVPDARAGFKAIARALKPGGLCFIWVYHPIDDAHHPRDRRKLLIYNWIRRHVTSRLPIRWQYLLYLSATAAFLIKQSGKRLLHGKRDTIRWREKMQDLFDSFSPVYAHRFSAEEVSEWFAKEGFANVSVTYRESHGFGMRGQLSKQAGALPQNEPR